MSGFSFFYAVFGAVGSMVQDRIRSGEGDLACRIGFTGSVFLNGDCAVRICVMDGEPFGLRGRGEAFKGIFRSLA